MVNRNLIRSLESDQEIDSLFQSAVADIEDPEAIIGLIATEQEFVVNKIVEGRIIRVDDEFVLVDVGFKSEGSIPRHEWDPDEDPPAIGQTVKVLIEEVENEPGVVEEPFGMGVTQPSAKPRS